MRIALLADIHGNYVALEAVLNDLNLQKVDRTIVLGDLVFKGPEPEKCVVAVQALQAPVIRGNIDELVGEGRIQDGFAQDEQHKQALLAELEWTRSRLSTEQLEYLRSLPLLYETELPGSTRLRCVHATPQSILATVLPGETESQFEQMFVANHQGMVPDIVAYAHIHVPFARFFNGRLIFNTGSVGLTFDGDVRASYALLDVADDGSTSLELRRVRYNVDLTVAAFSDSGHPCADSVIAAIRGGRKPI
jgi:predicted phosphodiesterase